MALLLTLSDYSYKENEVTGDSMGGTEEFTFPLSMVHIGPVRWLEYGEPGHSVEVRNVGLDYVSVSIRTVSGDVYGPYKLYLGDKASMYYEFGEWSYGYEVFLKEIPEDQAQDYTPFYALKKAIEVEKSIKHSDGKCDYFDFKKTQEAYYRAARLGSEDAYAWLVKYFLTQWKTSWGDVYRSEWKAEEYLKEAISRGIGGKAQEVYRQYTNSKKK